STYPANLKVECLDRVGIAGDILKKVSDNKVNLRDLRVETSKDRKSAIINLILEVQDIEQLKRCSQAISQISDVIRVHRKENKRKKITPPKKAPSQPYIVTPLKQNKSKAERKSRAKSGE